MSEDLDPGAKFQAFAEQGLFQLLMDAICGDCFAVKDGPEEQDDPCEGCPGNEMLHEMERQMGEAGIQLVEQIVDEWKTGGSLADEPACPYCGCPVRDWASIVAFTRFGVDGDATLQCENCQKVFACSKRCTVHFKNKEIE
jgi:hypothetical protein